VTAPVVSRTDGSGDSDRAALEAERDRLLASLRDIESERAAGDLPDAEYQALRDEYTVRAAEVLRRLGTQPASTDPASPTGPGDDGARQDSADAPADEPAGSEGSGAPARGGSRRRLRIVIAAAGATLVIAGALVLVVGGSSSRQPGQTVSGNVPPSPAQELVAARHAMATGDQVMALRLYQAVLDVEPNQPEALAYSGWLLRLSGDVQKNKALIDAAVAAERASEAADPAYPDPHFFLGVILLDDLHDPTAAIPQLTAYLGSSPSPAVRKAVEPVLARARQEAEQQPATSTPGSGSTP
jgi:hypothetical protein